MAAKSGYISLLLEVHKAEIDQGRVPASGIVEALDVIGAGTVGANAGGDGWR